MSQFILLEAAPSSMFGNIIVVSGAFLILVILIKKFAWGMITSMFEERAKKINDDIDNAEAAPSAQRADHSAAISSAWGRTSL